MMMKCNCLLLLLICIRVCFSQTSYLLPPDTKPVDSLAFPYVAYHRVESYSFNRDTAASRRFIEIIRELSTDLKPSQSRLSEFDSLYIVIKGERSILKEGKILESAQQIKTIGAEEMDSLILLFSIPTDTIVEPDVSCWPHYRDALVFYNDSNEIVGVIDICFTCGGILRATPRFYFDLRRWQTVRLRDFFIRQMGHPIEPR